MTKQNQTGAPPVDRHVLYLVNRSIDGEISVAEKDELKALLAASPEVRHLHDELREVTRLLDEAPKIEPPPHLEATIERQVRLPVQSHNASSRWGFLGNGWLNSNWLRTGFALAAGVVLTVGIYEMGSEPITPTDETSMVGTMAKRGSVDTAGTLLDKVQLNTARINGLVELRSKEDFFTLDLQLSTSEETGVIIDFAGRGMEFDGFSGNQPSGDDVSVVDGSIYLAGNSEQHYTVRLKRLEIAQNPRPLEVSFVTDDELILRAELIISRQ